MQVDMNRAYNCIINKKYKEKRIYIALGSWCFENHFMKIAAKSVSLNRKLKSMIFTGLFGRYNCIRVNHDSIIYGENVPGDSVAIIGCIGD